jgi:hypothetical protein
VAGQESLGTAVLQLTVDDSALRKGIADAKKFIGRELGQAFSGKASGGRGRSGTDDRLQATRIISRRLGDELQKLANRGVNVTRQFKQLNAAITAAEKGQTETARARNKGIADFIRLENRAYAATKKRNQISGRSTFQSPIRGSLRQPGSPIFSERGARQGGARESIDALSQAQKRRYSLDQQIRSLEAAGVRTDRLRTTLGEVTTAQANRQFGLAKQLGNQLEFNLRKERDKLRVQQQQQRESDRQLQRAKQLGGARSAIGGATFIPGSPAYIREVARQTQKAERDRVREQARSTRATRAEIAEGRRIGRLNTSPVRGGVAFPGSPAALEREQRRREATRRTRIQGLQGRISSGLVGGAFPLLFGQGVGAAVGGGLGGLAGGSKFGFGLSLVGTIIGSAFDDAINKAKTLAAALDDPISSFDALKESALLSSRAVEKQAQALIQAGRTGEAYALIQQDLAARFGDASTAKELVDTTDKLTRRWSELSTVVGILTAGPLEKLAAQLLNLLGPAGAQLAFETRIAKLTPAQQKEAQQIKETELRKIPSFASSDAYAAAYTNALTAVNEVFGVTQQQVTLENNIRTSKATQLGIDNARIQIAKEEDRILSLQLQKRQIELERTRELNALGENAAPAARDKLMLDTKIKLLEIERQISDETKRRDEKQKKAAEDLLDLRLQNLKFLPKAERQSLIRQVGQPAVAEAQRRGVTLRSFSEIRDFSQFLKQEQQLRQDAGPELVSSNQQLNGTLQSTAEVVTGLIKTMDSLREKSWEVHVTIPGQNSSKTVDTLNQLS